MAGCITESVDISQFEQTPEDSEGQGSLAYLITRKMCILYSSDSTH